MIVWIIGRGGSLGRAFARQAEQRQITVFEATSIPWGDREAVAQAMDANANAFEKAAATEPWAVIWAAGGATVAADAVDADAELAALDAALSGVQTHRPQGAGAFFLTSSSAVYAGSANPPFDERTLPVPTSDYGSVKLRMEHAATEHFEHSSGQYARMPLVIGRFANFVGPIDDLERPKGLVPRLIISAAFGTTVTMNVPLTMTRDYIDIDEAASQAMNAIEQAIKQQPRQPAIRVIASGVQASLQDVVDMVERVSGRRVTLEHREQAAQHSHPAAVPLVPSTPDRDLDLEASIARIYEQLQRDFPDA